MSLEKQVRGRKAAPKMLKAGAEGEGQKLHRKCSRREPRARGEKLHRKCSRREPRARGKSCTENAQGGSRGRGAGMHRKNKKLRATGPEKLRKSLKKGLTRAVILWYDSWRPLKDKRTLKIKQRLIKLPLKIFLQN